jgi:hypothetical protein
MSAIVIAAPLTAPGLEVFFKRLPLPLFAVFSV